MFAFPQQSTSSSRPRPLPWFQIKLLALGAAVLIALGGLWWVTLERVAHEAEEATSAELQRNDRLALAHEEQTRLVLRLLDESMRALMADPARIDALLSGKQNLPGHLLLRGIRLGLANAQGQQVGDSVGLPPEWTRELVRHHREAPAGTAFVQTPVELPGGQSWTTTLSRPLYDRLGLLQGVIFVRLDPQVFLDFFQKAQLGPTDVVLLLGDDGRARARRAGAALSYGDDHSTSPLVSEAQHQPNGSFISLSPVDGTRRFYSFRKLPDYGLTAAVGTSYDAVMAPVSERSRRYYAIATLGSLLIVASALALGQSLARHERAAARLQASEQRFRALTHMAADWYWETDAQHRFTDVVKAPRYQYGAIDYALGMCRWELPGVDGDPALWVRHREDLERHVRFIDFEMRRADPDGRERVALISGEPVFDDQGVFQGYRGVGHDVTAQREAQDARRATEERLAGIIESAMDAIITVDAQQRIVVFNAAAAEMFRCAPEQALGQPLEILLPARFRAAHPGQMRGFARHHASPRAMGRGTHIWALRANGEEFPADASISHIEVNGMPLYSVVMRDITARLAAERSLRASEESYRLLFENNLDGLLLGDESGAVRRVNPAACRLLGHSDQEVLGRGLSLLEGPGNPLARSLAQCTRSGHARGEFAVVRPDGTTVQLEVAFAAFREGDGARRISVLLHDVTERQLALERQAQLATQLRQSQKMEALGSIAGGIAHDFNNVIAAILGNARLAQVNLGCAESAGKYLNEISAAGYRARELVKRILTFSRKQPAVFVRQPLGPVVREAVALLRATLPSGVSITLQGDEADLAVRADATQLHQVVMNLGTNAWQALGQRTGRIDVRLEFLPASGMVRLSVQDDGRGMDAATQARIFEPFFTTKPEGEGTGLGLAVVQDIVEAHEGFITVSSEPGRGARFDVLLPLAEDQPAHPVTSEPPQEVVADAPVALPPTAGRGRHVVYVDDYAAMVAMISAVLQAQGYRVSGFDDSTQALEFIRSHAADVDLLVTDYNMPGMSGLDLSRAARALRPDLPIVVASGYLSGDLREGAQAAGVNFLFDKPAGIDELCRRIEALLETQAQRA